MKKAIAALFLLVALVLCACSNQPEPFAIQRLADLQAKDLSAIPTDQIVSSISTFTGKEASREGDTYLWKDLQLYYYLADITSIELHAAEGERRRIILHGPEKTGADTKDLRAYAEGVLKWADEFNKQTGATGTAFVNGKEWEDALHFYPIMDFEQQARDAYFLTMALAAMEGECQLQYNWEKHNVTAYMRIDSYRAEYTVFIDD